MAFVTWESAQQGPWTSLPLRSLIFWWEIRLPWLHSRYIFLRRKFYFMPLNWLVLPALVLKLRWMTEPYRCGNPLWSVKAQRSNSEKCPRAIAPTFLREADGKHKRGLGAPPPISAHKLEVMQVGRCRMAMSWKRMN